MRLDGTLERLKGCGNVGGGDMVPGFRIPANAEFRLKLKEIAKVVEERLSREIWMNEP